jgi:serine/threonine protein kinase
MAYLVGQRLGNYRVVRLLGQGGFAEVYLGEHVRLGMKAAIKVLHTHLVGEAISAFEREAQTVADLTHSHIVRVLDFDLQDGRPFLILDYAPNGSLRQKHPRGTRVPLVQVVSYVQQVASALVHAHERKLIHRDIKPENMLIGKEGEILLSDFGIVTMAHSTSSMNTQAALGTLAYMAPEQIQGKPRPASDQYALAVTVYQWLSGQMPFQGSSTEMIAQHLGVTPPSLREKVPKISPGVEWVVMKALSKDPKERFEGVQEFARALEQAAEGLLEQQTMMANHAASSWAQTASGSASAADETIPVRQSPASGIDSVRSAPQKVTSGVEHQPGATTPPLPSNGQQQEKDAVVRWFLVVCLLVVIGGLLVVCIVEIVSAFSGSHL